MKVTEFMGLLKGREAYVNVSYTEVWLRVSHKEALWLRSVHCHSIEVDIDNDNNYAYLSVPPDNFWRE